MSLLRILVAAVIATALLPAAGPASTGKSPVPPAEQLAVATINDQQITVADVLAQAQSTVERQDKEYHRQLRQLQSSYEQARYALLQQQLDEVLDARALELEATHRGVPAETILAEISVSSVSDDEVHAYYDANKDRASQSFEVLAEQIKEYLAGQHREKATRAFYDELRSRHHIVAQLEPYRVTVAAAGPARGRAGAPVTIVEFGDFQCPFCKQEESILKTLVAKYPDQVRLVFRELPLTNVHPDAMSAATAAVCADRQGKFWDMHDAMYADQTALKADALKSTAVRLGLDSGRFSACLADHSTTRAIEDDVSAADELGVSATPSFFINGRPVIGSVPAEKLEAVIVAELHRAGQSPRT